ncbi:MAG: BamA/TamA family outer membrane protein, partial [Gemmatimonadales bacterium]|nr:BamA/TamA family outer membrane protein [Gemmatimonadales bacterium]
ARGGAVAAGRPGAAPRPPADGPVDVGGGLVGAVSGTDSVTQIPMRYEGALYRTPQGFRPADLLLASSVPAADSTFREQVSLLALRDSARLNLPDTTEFTFKPYKVHFTADYVARPSVGFFRDNFGQGFFGGSAVSLSDMLGNHNLTFAGFINGRIDESQIVAAYTNLTKRVAWTVGLQQNPLFFFQPSSIQPGRTPTEQVFVQRLRRLIFRSAFARAAYPLTRFARLEAGLSLTSLDDGELQIRQPYSTVTGLPTAFATQERVTLATRNYATPSVAAVFDNTLFGIVGPWMGRRARVEWSRAVGDWQYDQVNVDLRRYDGFIGPATIATRAYFLGRSGRDSNLFPMFIGFPELLRGYTSGSFFRNECVLEREPNSPSGCPSVDQLIGNSTMVANVELRMPLNYITRSNLVPSGLPPIEVAAFYDVGVAFNSWDQLRWRREPGDNPFVVRAPLQSVGASLRLNMLGFAVLRFDLAFPLNRPGFGNILLFSIGPTF